MQGNNTSYNEEMDYNKRGRCDAQIANANV